MVSLIIGFLVAFLLAALPGRWAIERMRKLGAKQNISADAPAAHSAKQGTPTMGGLLILASLTVTTLLYFFVTQLGVHSPAVLDYTLLQVLLLTLCFGLIGFIDDLLSARRGKNLGLKAREKLVAQFLFAVIFVYVLALRNQPGLTTYITLTPSITIHSFMIPEFVMDLRSYYYPLAVLYIVGLSNAVNFTDGLDGLAGGVAAIICIALIGTLGMGLYPMLDFYTIALAGAVVGFLWWNVCPAKVFMGDTGSLAIGAGLAGLALLGKQEVSMLLATTICWVELLSVMIQVSVFKWRKRRYGLDYAKSHRVFRRTPLHHHFEELGWAETLVVQRFWIVCALTSAAALLWRRG